MIRFYPLNPLDQRSYLFRDILLLPYFIFLQKVNYFEGIIIKMTEKVMK